MVEMMPVPVAARSKASVCGRLPAEIVGSNPAGVMDVCLLWVLCVVRSVCDRLITRPEDSYWLWCVVVCDLETSSRMRRPWPTGGCGAIGGGKWLKWYDKNRGFKKLYKNDMGITTYFTSPCKRFDCMVWKCHMSYLPAVCDRHQFE